MIRNHYKVKLGNETFQAHYLTSPIIAEFTALNLANSNAAYLGLDIETSKMEGHEDNKLAGLNPYLSNVRLVQIFDGLEVYIFDLKYYPISILERLFEAKRFIAYNALFELQHIMLNVSCKPYIGCAFLMYKIFWQATQEEDKSKKFKLANAAKDLLYLELDKEMQLSDWSLDELTVGQITYAAIDAIIPHKLATRLIPMLKQADLMGIYNLNQKAQYPLTEMALNGIKIDTDEHNKLIEEWDVKRRNAELQVRNRVGTINLNSPKQLSDWALNKSGLSWKSWPRSPKTGHLKFDKKTLAERGGLPFVKELVEYKTYQKLISTYGHRFAEFINPWTNRVHPNFTLCQTETGRLSCRSPNLQNQPRTANFRKIFIADPRYTLVVADYSQIELRCAAEISQDSKMLAAYNDGLDLHRITAASISGCAFNGVTKEQRQMAKAVNFGLIFGSGAKKLREQAKQSYQVEMTMPEAKAAVDTFRETYPEYRQWQIRQAQQAEQTMKVKTPLGKVRRLSEMGYYTRSMNTPIQGAAAEVMLLALINLYNNKFAAMSIVNCVHDEIILEAPKELADEARALLEKSMVDAWVMVFPEASTRDLVDCNVGDNWAEAK